MRAVETGDGDGKILSEEDRNYSARAAVELTRWQAAGQGSPPSSETFIAKRAELLTAKLAERFPKVLRAIEAKHWMPWIGAPLPVLAFIVGAAAEQFADRHRVNILAFPMLGLLAWNIIAYLFAGCGGGSRAHRPMWPSCRMVTTTALRTPRYIVLHEQRGCWPGR